jgi:glycosyltransferase involved in cell wall biosynthesis
MAAAAAAPAQQGPLVEGPLVSIVVPARNGGAEVRALLASLAQSTYRSIEVVVNDDPVPGDDAAEAVADAARAGMAARYVADNHGMAAARQVGATLAQGEILLHLDTDMRLTPRLIEDCVRKLGQSFDALVIPERGESSGFWERCKALEKRCYDRVDVIESLRCIRADGYWRIGGHDPTLLFGEDKDLDIRARAAGLRVGWSDEVVIHNEGERGLLSTMRKKRSYAATAGTYATKHPEMFRLQTNAASRLRLVLARWRLGRRHPLLYAGIFLLGLAELVGLWLGTHDAARARTETHDSRSVL